MTSQGSFWPLPYFSQTKTLKTWRHHWWVMSWQADQSWWNTAVFARKGVSEDDNICTNVGKIQKYVEIECVNVRDYDHCTLVLAVESDTSWHDSTFCTPCRPWSNLLQCINAVEWQGSSELFAQAAMIFAVFRLHWSMHAFMDCAIHEMGSGVPFKKLRSCDYNENPLSIASLLNSIWTWSQYLAIGFLDECCACRLTCTRLLPRLIYKHVLTSNGHGHLWWALEAHCRQEWSLVDQIAIKKRTETWLCLQRYFISSLNQLFDVDTNACFL